MRAGVAVWVSSSKTSRLITSGANGSPRSAVIAGGATRRMSSSPVSGSVRPVRCSAKRLIAP